MTVILIFAAKLIIFTLVLPLMIGVVGGSIRALRDQRVL